MLPSQAVSRTDPTFKKPRLNGGVFYFLSFFQYLGMVIHDSFADFVLFLYIHMAHADGVYHPAEKDVIAERIPRLFPGEADVIGKLAKAEKQYLSVDKSKIESIIKDTFKHFSNVKFAQKYKVYTDMYDIIHADGKVEESESKALNELKDIIEMGVVMKRG